jgi:hypothetical protein
MNGQVELKKSGDDVTKLTLYSLSNTLYTLKPNLMESSIDSTQEDVLKKMEIVTINIVQSLGAICCFLKYRKVRKRSLWRYETEY